MSEFASQHEYLAFCESQSVLPEGFTAGATPITFKPSELGGEKEYRMNISGIFCDQSTPSFHAMFTKNHFCGAPVIIGKKHLKNGLCRGILVNNKISNVAVQTGEQDALTVLQTCSEYLGCPVKELFPSSTGIIGWQLPVQEMVQAIPALMKSMVSTSLLSVAQAIMTTDSYPKVYREICGSGSIVGTAKGAGMIEPNMGTMLSFICTDISVSREQLAQSLSWAVEQSFNRISIDGDQSTSDMIIILSSNKKPLADLGAFNLALLAVCKNLSHAIVRNGEGVEHVIKATISHAPSLAVAEQAGKAIVNSPLVKSAIFGNDPNVGRIIGALGDYFGNNKIPIPRDSLSISMGNIDIFSNNGFCLDKRKEQLLTSYLKEASYSLQGHYPPHQKTVDIFVDLKAGEYECSVIGADLSYDYVRENAAYRS
ncbi:MAG: bifunctional ornithine acetyltransferase/N-acetylglutamate synthase [Spirochaetales bacterium]|nr:bifunctional ornithine acetyltransferase/N-acetylglutamate synthase [Spirochaetales bacterium]